jgi:hypothetical protein
VSEEESLPTFEECLAEVSTDRQRQFCREYLIDLCGTRAARRAGYAGDSAHVEQWRLKRKATVRAAIQAGLRELAEDAHVSPAWVIECLKNNASAAMVKGDIQAANRALSTIAKSLGMLDKDLNINLHGDSLARVVMYFPDNERGPKPKGITDDDGKDDSES